PRPNTRGTAAPASSRSAASRPPRWSACIDLKPQDERSDSWGCISLEKAVRRFRQPFLQRAIMKTPIRIASCLVILTCLVAVHGGQEKVTSEITVLVPEKGQEETIVRIYTPKNKEGKKYDGEGGTRTIKLSLEKDKEYKFKIEAFIEPNNYTKITRYKEITIKGGDNVKVDLT